MLLTGSGALRLGLLGLCLAVMLELTSAGHGHTWDYSCSYKSYPCWYYVKYMKRYKQCTTTTECTPYYGFTHRRLATRYEMYHMPHGDANDTACKRACFDNWECTGYEYSFAPSHPGNPEVQAEMEAAIAAGTTGQAGGRYLGETYDGTYIGPDCYQRCVGICTDRLYGLWDDPNFVRDDPFVTFYRLDVDTHCEYTYGIWPTLDVKCGHCLPTLPTTTTTTTTPTTTPADLGCPGEDFVATEQVGFTGLPTITGATTEEECADECLMLTYEQCSGYQFIDGTCYRLDLTADGVTVECDTENGVTATLNRRLVPPACETVEVSRLTAARWISTRTSVGVSTTLRRPTASRTAAPPLVTPATSPTSPSSSSPTRAWPATARTPPVKF